MPRTLPDGNYRALVREALKPFVPADATDKQKTDAAKVLTADAPYIVRDYVVKHPEAIGKTITLPIAAVRSVRSAEQGCDSRRRSTR